MLSYDEKDIISSCVRGAMCFGSNMLSAVKFELEDAGFKFKQEHEDFMFEKYEKLLAQGF
jgi:hypothetical protein